jgi:predicted amidohydrolase YtcJ
MNSSGTTNTKVSDRISHPFLLLLVMAFLNLFWSESASSEQDAFAIDVIFYNGKIATGNDDFEFVEAVAVRDERIAALGETEKVLALADTHTKLVDLHRKTVLPGFYDNHLHIGPANATPIARKYDSIMQDWNHIDSRESLFKHLKRSAAALPKGSWIVAKLKNENMPLSKAPTRWELDKVVPEHPVLLMRIHLMMVNSLALELADVTKETPSPPGGEIALDADGEPTGWLWEQSALRLVARIMPSPPLNDEAMRSQIRRELQELLPLGITSLNVAGVNSYALRWWQDAYAKWGSSLPRTTVQLRVWPSYDVYDHAEDGIEQAIQQIENLAFYTGFGSDRLKLGALKMSIDGGLSAAAFWTLAPYPDTKDNHGLIRVPPEAFYQVAKRAHDLGWQLGIHAIGDAAVKMCVDKIATILEENPRSNHRHYLHHVSVLPPEHTLKKMSELTLGVASQPNFAYTIVPEHAVHAFTPEGLASNNPQKSILSRGIHLSYGSDNMPANPLIGIYAAVTRRGIDGKVYGPEERVSLGEAIRAYTWGTAYLMFDEKNRGSLELGKLADMVVLGEDIFAVDSEQIKDIQIEKTIIGGEVLFSLN